MTDTDAKRKEIIKAAFRVFGELGYQSTTIKNIAEAAGMAPGSIYNYFTDKEDLFKCTVQEGWADFLSEFEGLVKPDSPLEERLDELIERGFQKLKECLPLLRGMLFESSRLLGFHEDMALFCSYVERLIDEGRKQDLLDIPEDGGKWRKLVKVTVNGVLFSVALTPPDGTDREIAEIKNSLKRFITSKLLQGETT